MGTGQGGLAVRLIRSCLGHAGPSQGPPQPGRTLLQGRGLPTPENRCCAPRKREPGGGLENPAANGRGASGSRQAPGDIHHSPRRGVSPRTLADVKGTPRAFRESGSYQQASGLPPGPIRGPPGALAGSARNWGSQTPAGACGRPCPSHKGSSPSFPQGQRHPVFSKLPSTFKHVGGNTDPWFEDSAAQCGDQHGEAANRKRLQRSVHPPRGALGWHRAGGVAVTPARPRSQESRAPGGRNSAPGRMLEAPPTSLLGGNKTEKLVVAERKRRVRDSAE